MIWLLACNVVPPMLFTRVQQLGLANPIDMYTVRANDIVFNIDAIEVAECQWPVVIWSSEQPPNTKILVRIQDHLKTDCLLCT